ncbi:MAG TPA: methyltransferase domain-containing protein [Polyangiaceae bacterium]|nr:methyltransferase domain-containing protein [Polyangiaceae bacterium]
MKIDLPYFDVLLDRLDHGHPELSTGFGRYVHWGYWGEHDRADDSMTGFAQAAERMSQRVCAAARVQGGQRILDVGCGWGGTIASLNDELSQVSLTGLNIDGRQLERARRRVRAKKGNSVTFVEGDACAMPLDDASFDVVIALECAFHFPDRRRFLAESRRVLRPGGRLVVADFVPAPVVVPFLPGQKLLFGPYMKHVLGPADVTYSVERYRDAASAHGLALSHEEDITRNTLPTYPILRQVAAEMGNYGGTARFGVTALEWVSKLRLLRYVILGFDAEQSAEEGELALMAGE